MTQPIGLKLSHPTVHTLSDPAYMFKNYPNLQCTHCLTQPRLKIIPTYCECAQFTNTLGGGGISVAWLGLAARAGLDAEVGMEGALGAAAAAEGRRDRREVREWACNEKIQSY